RRPAGGDAPRHAARAGHPARRHRRRRRAAGLPRGGAVSGEPVLAVRDLTVVIGGRHILHGVRLDVPPSGVTALLGRNGAGKTTTVRGVLGLVPRTGSVRLCGEETVRLATHALVRRGIGYAPEDRGVFAALTVAENLRLAERPGAGQ